VVIPEVTIGQDEGWHADMRRRRLKRFISFMRLKKFGEPEKSPKYLVAAQVSTGV